MIWTQREIARVIKLFADTNLYKTLEDGSIDLSKEFSGVGLRLGDDDESVVVQDVTLEILRGARLHRTLLVAT